MMITLAALHRKASLTPLQELNHFIHGRYGTAAFGVAIVAVILLAISSALSRS